MSRSPDPVESQPTEIFTWLREGYAHKSAEVGYLAAEADRLKWLYDQSVHQVSLLKTEIEKLTKKLEDNGIKKDNHADNEPSKRRQLNNNNNNNNGRGGGGRFQNRHQNYIFNNLRRKVSQNGLMSKASTNSDNHKDNYSGEESEDNDS
ncbi:11399_t:CDS:2 [Diversispora eburnea]|uniref:11399_t:CDS:1 n=1 Tax=Diversispora eburnea TaxID=1213867 RepID=A0A9N8WLD5_9GLOM|nr:11399_t:CDS:2 [Diversispora eburnea]